MKAVYYGFYVGVTAPDDAGTSVPSEEYFLFLHPLQVHTMGNPCVVIKCAREQKKLLAGTLRCYLVWFFILFFCLFSSSFSSASCTTPHCTKGVLLQKMKC